MEDWGLINVEVKNYENLRYDSEKNLFYLISARLDYSNVQLKFITKNCDGLMIADNKINCDNFIELNISKPLDVIVYKDEETKIYTIQGIKIGLPTININVPLNKKIDKESYIKNTSFSLTDEDNVELINCEASIKGQRNITWTYDKKSYIIKFKNKTSLLGMNPGKKWCLLANYKDRAIIRTELGFWISKKSKIKYTPDGRFVEVVFNGKEIGLYYLCEKPVIDENRININTFNADNFDDSGFVIYSNDNGKLLEVKDSLGLKYPKIKDTSLIQPVLKYLYDKIDTFEKTCTIEELKQIIDIDSLIDYLLIIELIEHNDIFVSNNRIRNFYIQINKGKILLGPLWDLEALTFENGNKWVILKHNKVEFCHWGTFNCDSVFIENLRKNKEFIKLVIKRWDSFKSELTGINDYIDSLYNKLEIAYTHNTNIWGTVADNPWLFKTYKCSTFIELINEIKKSINNRIKWLDENLLTLLNFEES